MISATICADRARIVPILRTLRRDNLAFRGTGGVSEENRCMGFSPAFLDSPTGQVYRCRFPDGSPAPCHLLHGIPEALLVKSSLVSGFIRDGRFYTREQAAHILS